MCLFCIFWPNGEMLNGWDVIWVGCYTVFIRILGRNWNPSKMFLLFFSRRKTFQKNFFPEIYLNEYYHLFWIPAKWTKQICPYLNKPPAPKDNTIGSISTQHAHALVLTVPSSEPTQWHFNQRGHTFSEMIQSFLRQKIADLYGLFIHKAQRE